MQILDVEQNSPEWHRARAGIPTASQFKTVLAQGRGGGTSKTRQDYLYRLAGELITGEPAETYSNQHMQRGHELEEEARKYYAFARDCAPEPVGFIKRDDESAGCSPDSLIGEDGMLEIKTALPHILIAMILKGDFPPEHKAQCQGQLWIAEREWVDLTVYWPAMPPFIKREFRDERYITSLTSAVARFNEELAEIRERIRRYEMQEAA